MSAVLGSKAGLDPVRDEGFDPRSELGLKPKNVAKVVSERIMSVRFLPFVDRTVVVVGNKIGNLGFWDLDYREGDGDGIYVYQPHSGPVSGISVHPFSPRKVTAFYFKKVQFLFLFFQILVSLVISYLLN